MMARLTEGDIIALYMPLVRHACQHAAKNLEMEDRFQCAMMGLLYAIRTHRAGSFRAYAAECIQATLRGASAIQRRAQRCESTHSLDKRIPGKDGSTCAYLDLQATPGDAFALFDLVDAIKSAIDTKKACRSTTFTQAQTNKHLEYTPPERRNQHANAH